MTYRHSISFYTRITAILATFLLTFSFASQGQTLDKVIAVVGKNRIILQSELDVQMAQIKQQSPDQFHDSIKCGLLQQLIITKLMVEQAERDSLIVSEEEVEATLDNRVRYFVSLYGSKEKLEQASGKTIYQLKDENRDIIRETMMAERMQGQIMQNVRVTPAEVQKFFGNIPVDSLPFFPAAVEMGQIVVDPEVSPELDKEARLKLEGIRKEIVEEGKSFEAYAGLYSEDPGSRDNGGDLGMIGRNDLVPEFAAAAFKLQNGEVSQIVKTKFGYHIIQMIRRQGDQAHLRHILVKPKKTSFDFNRALQKLDSVRAQLIAGTITFPEAVGKYATDEMSKQTGGMIVDPATGSSRMEVANLDASLALMIDSLQIGSFSKPQIFDAGNGERSTRIVYLKSSTLPHKANLRDDYNRIQEAALNQKKAENMQEWLNEKTPSFYMQIDSEYHSCPELQMFLPRTTTAAQH